MEKYEKGLGVSIEMKGLRISKIHSFSNLMRVIVELLTHSPSLAAVLQNTIVTRHRCGSPFVGGPSPSVPTNGRVLALKIQQIVAAQLLS